jgi:hypothetical protein
MASSSAGPTNMLESLSAITAKLHEIDSMCLSEGGIEPLRGSILSLLSAQASLLQLLVDRMTVDGEPHGGSMSPPRSGQCPHCRSADGLRSSHNPYRPSRARSG